MSEYTTKIYDYGFCEFCSQSVEIMGESYLHVRIKDEYEYEYETRVAHEECWVAHLDEEEEE